MQFAITLFSGLLLGLIFGLELSESPYYQQCKDINSDYYEIAKCMVDKE